MPGDGQGSACDTKEAVTGTGREGDSCVVGPSFFAYTVCPFWHKPILVPGDGVLLWWWLALSPPKAAWQGLPWHGCQVSQHYSPNIWRGIPQQPLVMLYLQFINGGNYKHQSDTCIDKSWMECKVFHWVMLGPTSSPLFVALGGLLFFQKRTKRRSFSTRACSLS